MPPRFFFVIDVSYVAVTSGALPVICQAIRDSLDRLPGGERTQVGFLTFDSTMHFYNLASRLSQPQMMVGCPPAVPCARKACFGGAGLCCTSSAVPMLAGHCAMSTYPKGMLQCERTQDIDCLHQSRDCTGCCVFSVLLGFDASLICLLRQLPDRRGCYKSDCCARRWSQT